MKYNIIIILTISLLIANEMPNSNLHGVDFEQSNNSVRCVTSPAGNNMTPPHETRYVGKSRAEVLWVDRNHQNAIAEHVAISGNGMFIQTGWYLNNERTSCYRSLASNIPQWTFPLANAAGYIPVAVNPSADKIIVSSPGEPVYCFKAHSPVAEWITPLPAGYTVAASAHGPSVVISNDGQISAALGRQGDQAKLFLYDINGDTIRTINFNPTSGIYGLDASSDGSVLCISTYYGIFVFNNDGSLRDSVPNYGQTVAKLSGDGSYLVKGDFNQRTYLYHWNGSQYDLVWQHATGHPWVTAVAISEDGSTIMAGTFQYNPSNTGKVLMYDSSSATPLWEYTQYGDYVSTCALSNDGSRGIAGSWGQYNGTYGDVVTVFNRNSATPIFQLLDDIDEPGSIFSVSISHDGSFVTAGGKAVHAREFGNGGETYAIRIIDSLTIDVGVEEISNPGAFLETGMVVIPQATVTNYGTQTASFNAVCMTYDSLAQAIHVDTVYVDNLSAGASQAVVFSNWLVSEYGWYETNVFTVLSGDEFPMNDSLLKVSICYHDAAVTNIGYPFSELTLAYARAPRVDIMNRGSYTETIPVQCEIYDDMNALVYTGNGQANLAPLASTAISLMPTWTPSDTIIYTSYIFTQVPDDYNPGNDTMDRLTDITTEIMFDDGLLNVYGYVSPNFYDNKFAEKMIPCLSDPYYITQARIYVSSSDPIILSLNRDSVGLPGLNPMYIIAPPETLSAPDAGWLTKIYAPAIQMTTSDPFWVVAHWLSSSPNAPYIGMDNTFPRDSLSYWYWSEPSDPGWHQWVWYDFMMRVYTTAELGIKTSEDNNSLTSFIMQTPQPNPFVNTTTLRFTIPRTSQLDLKMYDITGRIVKTHSEKIKASGYYQIAWDNKCDKGFTLSSGVYFLKAQIDDKTKIHKLILITR